MKSSWWLIIFCIAFFPAEAQIINTKKSSSKKEPKTLSYEQLYQSAIASFNKKNYTEAIQLLEKCKEVTTKPEDYIICSHIIAESLIETVKYPKSIKEAELALKKSIALKNEKLTERSYELLYLAYSKSGNEKKATEYYGYYNSFKVKRENLELEKKNKVNQLQINKLAEQKLRSELGKTEAENQLEAQTTRLLKTKDSLLVLDILNKQSKAQIELLQTEKDLRDIKVKEQEARLKINQLALKKRLAEQERQQMILLGLILFILLILALAYVLFKNFKQKQAASAKIEQQLEVIQHQHSNISNSINYAKRIQGAMLPDEKALNYLVNESFVLFKPRDVVSGDFYWFYNIKTGSNLNEYDVENATGVTELPNAEKSRKIIVSAVDCTGHGVPGALMSMIGYNLLNMIASRDIFEVDKILTELHKNVRFALQQYKNENNDGMDMSLCVIDKDKKTIEFAGAKNPLVYIQDGELFHIKGDIHPIGGSQGKSKRTFTKHTISIEKPTTIYLFSDGYSDQFGGPEKKKFMIKNFKELLLKIHTMPFDEQKNILDKTIEDWKGGHEKQLDDILVMGMKVGG